MKKTLLVLAIALVPGVALATKYQKKIVDGWYDGATLGSSVNPDNPAVNAGSINAGTAATGVTVVEKGDGVHHTTELTLADLALESVSNGDDANGVLLYTLPAGAQGVEGVRLNVSFLASNGDSVADTPDVGIGTTKANGSVAVLGGTAAFENILTGQTFNDSNGTAETTIGLDVGLGIDTSGDKTVYLNYADGWANGTDLTANGTIILDWIFFE